jgi:glycosyltransferase involved in cell wall biosynthesis
MARVDLHVHSKYSEHPSDWFLRRIGAKESYTEPEAIYRMAKDRGMDFVTITDHNRIEGSLLLHENHPSDTFTGVEFTTYFPGDGCKVHILVYGLTLQEFEELDALRTDIYRFSRRLKEMRLACSVAHATYPVNGMLTPGHLEEILLLFDVFEGINGGRNSVNNETWTDVLSSLSHGRIGDLIQKHGIQPSERDPWIKGLTGGSDDHAGLFVGCTSTIADASDPGEFLEAISDRRTRPGGRSNDYQSLVFTVYRIAYEYSRQKRNSASRGLLVSLTELVFERKDFRLKERLFMKRLSSAGGNRARVYKLINGLIEDVRSHSSDPLETRLGILYSRISDLTDEFLRSLVSSIKKDIAEGDIVGFVTNASASIPGIFLSLPFFSAVREMFSNRELLEGLRKESAPFSAAPARRRRILWFTDTFSDLNGVSVTLEKIAELAGRSDSPDSPSVRIVTSLETGSDPASEATSIVELPCIDSFSLPGYEKYLLKIPSILKALEMIARCEPDEIYISTPGPIGLTGLLVARLMSVKAVGFFHTDYARQAARIISDEAVTGLIEAYVRWFYGCCDEVRVPTDEYISILKSRGYEFRRVARFDRGIDTKEFSPVKMPRHLLAVRFGLEHGPVLLYTGRISKEKNLDVAIDAFRQVQKRFPETNLVLAGDGPFLEELKEKTADITRVRFLGRIPHGDLPSLYSLADLLVFPSETDTFGMSVLEAQSCGLPALVSATGGPKEIIEDGVTGFVIRNGDPDEWAKGVIRVLEMMKKDHSTYMNLRREARSLVLHRFDWERNFAAMFDSSDHWKAAPETVVTSESQIRSSLLSRDEVVTPV